MSEPLKRLELRLPESHPVWELPDGARAKIVREWLEVGRKLTEIEASLQEINEKLNTGVPINKDNENIVVSEYNKVQDPQTGFDKNTFLNHFK